MKNYRPIVFVSVVGTIVVLAYLFLSPVSLLSMAMPTSLLLVWLVAIGVLIWGFRRFYRWAFRHED